MEFLRFGSSIPGTYWGCCAADIIQNFKVDPDAKASIQCVDGDGGSDLGGKFLGKTYREIFLSRLRIGTFGLEDMPNHAFIATMTQWQLQTEVGKKWLQILKETGFEFLRAVQNSVYSGQSLAYSLPDSSPDFDEEEGSNINYFFALFRNIGEGCLADPFTPPTEWTNLPSVKQETWKEIAAIDDSDGTTYKELAKDQHAQDVVIWNDIGPAKFYSKEELIADGVPVYLAGLRSEYPQELEEQRKTKQASKKA
jgi:hypothetical protein